MAETKEAMQYVEDFEKTNGGVNLVGLPASLTALSDEEMKKLGVKTTMKLDLIIMPALVIMYIL